MAPSRNATSDRHGGSLRRDRKDPPDARTPGEARETTEQRAAQAQGERQHGPGARGDVSGQRSGIAFRTGETACRAGAGTIGETKEKVMKTSNLYLLPVAVALALSACNRGPDQAKVQQDVAKAQADGQKMVADAQAKFDKTIADSKADVNKEQADANAKAATGGNTERAANNVADARTDANKDVAKAQYDLDKARAEANYNVAKAQCEAHTGDTEKACRDSAKQAYDSAVAAAKAKNDQVNQHNSG
jgi:hypothetical protein